MKRKKTAIMKKEGGREQSRDRRKIKMPEDGKMDQTKKVLCRVLMASLLVAKPAIYIEVIRRISQNGYCGSMCWQTATAKRIRL